MVTKREVLVGAWGRYEYRAVDFDRDSHRDAARACNDEVGTIDFEYRLNILKAAVRRMEAA